jgi:2-polyprenyl-6-methoxyphenol hydroxylase-like FAD-dependent oxidoreductase
MESAKNQPVYDVIISGAGPVGLFLACELALARCSVLLLEKAENPHSPLKQLPFGIRGLNAPSVEALDRRGLLQELELHKHVKNPHATPAHGGKQTQAGGHFAGIQFQIGNVDGSRWPYRLPTSTDTHLVSELAELETVLTRRAETLGVTIRRGLAVTDIQQTADGVAVQASNQAFAGQWLVGCDGGQGRRLRFRWYGTGIYRLHDAS